MIGAIYWQDYGHGSYSEQIKLHNINLGGWHQVIT